MILSPIDEQAASAMLGDPATSAAWLAEIAQQHPALWDRIAEHPSAYPHLIAWMTEHAAIARRQDPGLEIALGPDTEPVPAPPSAPSRRGPAARVLLFTAAAIAVAAVIAIAAGALLARLD
ncbi:hypothetical protein JD276_02095 [Leucobacter sp. CSA1]|uniref:Leucine rich repeat variant domain-containing protein n=1 Tax=Leucobacter chromiisoli TaxID=2796471 RepID=A0A934Q696_9MICO|nr:hypothetical protein [Leucobacter chromiisoli]MBK0417826.1 hypothetical protein [Leucobacter chromiisoli]